MRYPNSTIQNNALPPKWRKFYIITVIVTTSIKRSSRVATILKAGILITSKLFPTKRTTTSNLTSACSQKAKTKRRKSRGTNPETKKDKDKGCCVREIWKWWVTFSQGRLQWFGFSSLVLRSQKNRLMKLSEYTKNTSKMITRYLFADHTSRLSNFSNYKTVSSR